MGIRRRLLNYCPRPKKRVSRFFAKLATSLRIPRFKSLRMPKVHLLFGLTSFIVSLILFYSGTFILNCLMIGSCLDIGAYIGSPLAWLFSIPLFVLLWAVTHELLLEIRKKGSKVLLFVVSFLIIAPASFTAGLNYGIFDSITLLEDSVIDLSHCTAWLNIKNNGLTDVQISKIEIGNLICNVSKQYSYLWRKNLKRGKTATLGIYYARRSFQWGAILGRNPPYGAYRFGSSLEITPTTFTEGKYPVVIHTDGIIAYRFEIEARLSRPEEIYGFQAKIYNLGEERIGDQNYCLPDIEFRFEMVPLSVAFIYSVAIGNLTIKFSPPILVQRYEFYNDFDLRLFTDRIYVNGSPTTAIPSQPLNMPIFRVGETYNVTVRTMVNNNYTTSITMTE